MPNPDRVSYTPEQLAAGDFPIVKTAGVIAAGQVLAVGAVLGQITTGGHYKLSASAASDGSQAPVVVLDEAIDTTAGAASGVLRLTGEVLGTALTLGAGHTLAGVKAVLRPLSLFVR